LRFSALYIYIIITSQFQYNSYVQKILLYI